MSDGIRIFFKNKELEKRIRKEAAAQHLSPGAYIAQMVSEALAGKKVSEEVYDHDEDEDEERFDGNPDKSGNINIRLYGEDAIRLRNKARRFGINPTAYVRRLVRTAVFVDIRVETNDITELIQTYSEFEQAFTAAVGYIKRCDGEVFEQDIELLKDYMSEITDLFTKQVEMVYKSRLRVERKAEKYIKEQIDKAPRG